MTLLRLTVLGTLLASWPVQADVESRLRHNDLPRQIGITADNGDNTASQVYIVQLASPAAAEFHAASAPMVSAKTGAGALPSKPAFDKSTAVIESYVQKLEAEQAEVIARAGGTMDLLYNYRYALNGFAATMSPAIANKLEHMPEVLRVWQDEIRPLATNNSANFLELFNADVGLRGGAGLDGDGHGASI